MIAWNCSAATPGGSSSDYQLVTDIVDASSGISSSTDYQITVTTVSNFGSNGNTFESASTDYLLRIGYVPQLSSVVITSPSIIQGQVDTLLTYKTTVNVTAISFSQLGLLPPGLTFNSVTGEISGIPSLAGSYPIILKADTVQGTAAISVTFVIAPAAPNITSTLFYFGTVGQPFEYTIAATGSVPIAFDAAPLPQGINQSGAQLSGIPIRDGIIETTIQATNDLGQDSKKLIITISGVGGPVITSPLEISVNAGGLFDYTITALGNNPLLLSATNLPNGLNISNGRITGSVATVGIFTANIEAKNDIGMDRKQLNIVVNGAGAPVFGGSDKAVGKVGTQLSYSIIVLGGGITLSTSALPPGLVLIGSTITGIPLIKGTYPLTLTAQNSNGSSFKRITINVLSKDAVQPQVKGVDVSRNPVRTGKDVIFIASNFVIEAGLPARFTWKFLRNGVQDGIQLEGQTVTRQFSVEGEYKVVVQLNDTNQTSQDFDTFSVFPLEPSSLGGTSIIQGTAVFNPATSDENGNALGISVPDSLGGVLDFDGVNGVVTSLAVDSFETILPTRQANFGRNTAEKFTTPGIRLISVIRKSNGQIVGRARRMIPVGSREAGVPPQTQLSREITLPLSQTIENPQIKGKVIFTAGKRDALSLNCSIKMPGGVNMGAEQVISAGLGNIAGDIALDRKARATSFPSQVSKFSLKVTKLPKDKITVGGENAKVLISFSGSELDVSGLEFEGITNTEIDKKTPANRSLQVAFVISGVTYFSQLPIVYFNANDTGQIMTRRANRSVR